MYILLNVLLVFRARRVLAAELHVSCEPATCYGHTEQAVSASALMQHHQRTHQIHQTVVNEEPATTLIGAAKNSTRTGLRSLSHVAIKYLSNKTQLARSTSLFGGLNLLSTQSASEGRTHGLGKIARLDEVGYQAIVQAKSDDEMDIFMRRVIDAYDCEIIDDRALRGIVPWFSGTTAKQNFQKLEETLLYAVLSKSPKTWIHYRNSEGATGSSADLDFTGYVKILATQSPDEMAAFVRRVCKKLHVIITDETGFQGMLELYGGAEGFHDYEHLEQSLLSAARAPHSWAAFEPQ
jgi:hypothetical protein